MRLFLSSLAVFLVLAGCAPQRTVNPPPPVYSPPAPRPDISPELISDRGFDATWEALVDYVSATSFAIEGFERESGLLILSFSTTSPESVVECGTWRRGNNPEVPYIERDLGFNLRTRTNVLVQSIGGSRTRVRANTLYELRGDSGTVYNFTTNESATFAPSSRSRGSARTRTCQANHEAENRFLEGVRDALR